MNGGRVAGCGCLVLAGGFVACGLAVLLFVAALGRMLPQQMNTRPCQVLADSSSTQAGLSEQQRRNARIIAAVGKTMGVPPEGWVVAVATAMQESRLRNLDYGDRDSLGLFQQRPSMGWGTPAQVTDPRYAARQFYERLRRIDGWQSLQLTLAAQRVQRSAFPHAYQQWADLARLVVSNISDGGFTCPGVEAQAAGRTASGEWVPEQMGPDGLTPRTRHVMELIERRFDEHDIGGFCPGGCTTGHISSSDHYDGHAIDVMITPYTDPERVAKGRRIMDWLTANHRKLAIDYLIYRDRIWQPEDGWDAYTHPSGNTTDPTLRHLDHIHISVH